MNKKYNDELVRLLKEKEQMTTYHGTPLLVKNLPDCDEEGAMDPRLYNDMKNQLRILAWIPSKFMKLDVSEKGIARLRTMFNAKKSIPCVEAQIAVRDEYFQPGMEQFPMAPRQRRGLSKMIGMFGNMTAGLEPILGTKDVKNDYLNPYTRDARNNPPTFLTVGEHDFLKIETLGYGVKLHNAGVETKMVLYKGFGHAFFDNTGVYPQCEDCIDEMGQFILSHCQ